MRLSIKKAERIPFAKKEDYEWEGAEYKADIQNGDKVKFLDSGETEIGQFGEQYNFTIETRNGKKKIALNQTSVNVLVNAFGEDTENWIDKEVNVLTEKKMISGKKAIVVYLIVDGWYLDDFGALVKKEGQLPEKGNDIPVFDEDGNKI